MTRRALVTGADGFIGSHLVETLVAAGYRVKAMARYDARGSRGWLDDLEPTLLAEVELLSGDVCDAAFVREALGGCDVVFHLAALIGIPYSYRAAQSYVSVNVTGTLNILQAAKEQDGLKVIQTSTSEVYGTAQRVPIDESHPLQAQSPYAATKVAADQLALSFHRSFETPVVVLRPFNTYGPRQSRRAVIPTIIAQLLAGERAIALGSLHPTRDLTYVRDTAEGFLLADRSEAAVGEVINLGTGHEISIGDLAARIMALMGIEAEIATDRQRLRPAASEVERLCADTAKAAELLGWAPSRAGAAGLDVGLSETIDWFRCRDDSTPARAREYAV